MTAQPAAWNMFPNYVLTLGLYELIRRAQRVTVTNQRVVSQRGVLTRSTRSVPIGMIQDANTRTQLGVGWVVLSSAGGGPGTLRLGPFKTELADQLVDAILAQYQTIRT